MRYILDASVALCWVIPRPQTHLALRLRDEYQQRIHELIAPSHFPGEIANDLTKAERQKLIYVGDAHPRWLQSRAMRRPKLLSGS